jgi:hypothetical protein
MDPYLEQEVLWHDFHEKFIPAAAAYLAAQVLPRYIVLIDENVYLRNVTTESRSWLGRPDFSVTEGWTLGSTAGSATVRTAPTQITLPDVDYERESFLEVRDRQNRELITVVEVLSPTNKRPGDHRGQYLTKRSGLLRSPVHFVEIDLLRGGPPLPPEDRPGGPYSVVVSRAGMRPQADFWPFGLRDPLPTVPIPLKASDGDATLDLRAILNRVYDESGYAYFLYDHEPDPPLTGEEERWARSLIPSPLP